MRSGIDILAMGQGRRAVRDLANLVHWLFDGEPGVSRTTCVADELPPSEPESVAS